MEPSQAPVNSSCYPSGSRWSRGIFFGDLPFSFSTPLLLMQLSLCALLTASLHRLLTPLGQSIFISQILAGVILGPSLLGSINVFSQSLFPASSFYVVETFAFFGVMLYLFIIGVKTDLTLIRKSGKRAVAIGVCTFLMPLVLNFMLGNLLSRSIPMETDLHESIPWIGSFQAISSSHVIVCLLADLKLMNSDLGRLAISSSMVSGVCSWFWSLLVFTGKHGANVKQRTFVFMILFLVIMVLICIGIFRPIIMWMIKRTGNGKSVRESHICSIFIMVLFSALYGEYFGMHFLFGPIVLGLVIPDGPPLGSALVSKLELFVSSIILPIFFVVSAARIDISAISFRNFVIIEFLAFFALLWKIAGVMAPSLYCKMPVTDALYLGLILSNQGVMEILILERAKSIQLLDSQSYSIMVLSIVIITGILAPMVKYLYKPSKKYTLTGLTIQHANPNAELRILACLHYQEHTHSLLHLFGASYPHHQAPISFYVVHLVDLGGRSAPVLMAHHRGPRNPLNSNESEHIINALRFFEFENRGNVTVYPYTAISPYVSMHNDVCSLAAEKMVSLVIVLFHKHPSIHVSEVETNALRSVNHNIIRESPCSVGILIDRAAINCSSSISARPNVYRIGVIFLGGPDDREALTYASRMARHPNICLTMVRFVDNDYSKRTKTREMEQDLVVINEYTDAQMKNKRCFYQEEPVTDSMAVLSVIRSLESLFDLILVGRRHDENSPLLAGIQDWNEFPELGGVGDMLLSLDSLSEVSVLVVQQGTSSEDSDNAVLDMPRNHEYRLGQPQVSSRYVIMGR